MEWCCVRINMCTVGIDRMITLEAHTHTHTKTLPFRCVGDDQLPSSFIILCRHHKPRFPVIRGACFVPMPPLWVGGGPRVDKCHAERLLLGTSDPIIKPLKVFAVFLLCKGVGVDTQSDVEGVCHFQHLLGGEQVEKVRQVKVRQEVSKEVGCMWVDVGGTHTVWRVQRFTVTYTL